MSEGTNGWQPIETAPKDGTHILVYGDYYGGSRRYVAFWEVAADIYGDQWSCGAPDEQGFYDYAEPTHWQPLPPPPQGDRA